MSEHTHQGIRVVKRINAEKEGHLTLVECSCGFRYTVRGWEWRARR